MSDIVREHYKGPVEWIPDATILLVRGGSHSHGTNTETSDLDVDGIAIPPQKYFTGFFHHFEQASQHEPDVVIYDIRKFFTLAADCNPNVVQMLWVDPDDILYVNPWGRLLLQHREEFLSQKAKYTFSGYAIAQLKRIKTHRAWLLSPPKGKPDRIEYGLPETTLVSKDQMGVIAKFEEKGCDLSAQFGADIMDAYRRERSYHNALVGWRQYENWKNTRNPARAALEAKYGYDCKHGMHLVRLMRMCEEILLNGKIIVRRPDAGELLSIRNGAWSYERLVEWAEAQDARMNELIKISTLPHASNRESLDQLCRDIVESHFSIDPNRNS